MIIGCMATACTDVGPLLVDQVGKAVAHLA